MPVRIGLIGFGYIGSYLYREICAHPEWDLDVCFVHGSRAAGAVPDGLLMADLGDAESKRPDLIVEAAHPDVTRTYGAAFLGFSNYMPLSLTALAVADVEGSLRAATERHKRTLFIPHGAAVALDTLAECADLWTEVVVTMRKNPRNLDFAVATQFAPPAIKDETVLFDGPTREVCRLFPRNVNAHAAVALAGIGFDRTRSILIADPKLQESVIQLEASGDGIRLNIARSNPLVGVSGVLTLRSILGSILRTSAKGGGLQPC